MLLKEKKKKHKIEKKKKVWNDSSCFPRYVNVWKDAILDAASNQETRNTEDTMHECSKKK